MVVTVSCVTVLKAEPMVVATLPVVLGDDTDITVSLINTADDEVMVSAESAGVKPAVAGGLVLLDIVATVDEAEIKTVLGAAGLLLP